MPNAIFIHAAILDKCKEKLIQYLNIIENSNLINYVDSIFICFIGNNDIPIKEDDIIKYNHEKVPKDLFRFEIGIQTVNQKANLQVSRKQSFEKTKGIILDLQDKIEMHLDLIVGLALDEWDDIKYSIEGIKASFTQSSTIVIVEEDTEA